MKLEYVHTELDKEVNALAGYYTNPVAAAPVVAPTLLCPDT